MTVKQLRRRRYLTVAEFCAATGAKPDTVRARCERGEYRCSKKGARFKQYGIGSK